MNCKDKLLSTDEMITKMKNKGITFNHISEGDAEKYLKNNNNYFNFTSYRKNYTKDCNEKYVDLDFSYLKDLSIIDMIMKANNLKDDY